MDVVVVSVWSEGYIAFHSVDTPCKLLLDACTTGDDERCGQRAAPAASHAAAITNPRSSARDDPPLASEHLTASPIQHPLPRQGPSSSPPTPQLLQCSPGPSWSGERRHARGHGHTL